jgi:HK97 family phage portal protein
MWNPFRKKEKSLQQPTTGRGWFNVVREPFTGAWQRNIEINQTTVLSYYAVFSCITLIASDISKMPSRLLRRDSQGVWQEQESGSVAKLLKKPNAFQNRIQFYENWLNSKLCYGNTYVIKIRDNAGEIIELRILDPNKVVPLVADDGSVFYQISPENISGLEAQVTVPSREIIHDRFNCFFHPLVGLSPIYACGLAAMQGHHIQEGSAFFFKNGGKPSGVIEVPGSLTAENAATIKSSWDTGYTGENAGKTGILSNGAKYNPVSMSAVDAQLVEQQKMSAAVVCSAFHIPAYKVGVGDPPSSDNIEALEQQYYSQCLQVLIESIELLLDETFDLNGNTGTEFDVGALLRMDTERRIKTLGEAVKNTIMSPNEARKKENLPPVPGGNSLYLQQQNFSLEALSRRDASENPFSTSSAQPPVQPDKTASKGFSESEMIAMKAMIRGMIAK